MTTNEEFQTAIEMINKCIATIECSCEYDQEQAAWLELKCREFSKAYKEKVKSEV